MASSGLDPVVAGHEPGKGVKNMRLLTKALLKRFSEVGEQDIPNPIIVAHYFDPNGSADWYATAYDPETKSIFGWAEMIPGCGEWGYTSIDELSLTRIERDLYWKEKRASEVIPK
jgi:hypothetical protein